MDLSSIDWLLLKEHNNGNYFGSDFEFLYFLIDTIVVLGFVKKQLDWAVKGEGTIFQSGLKTKGHKKFFQSRPNKKIICFIFAN